MSTKSFNGRTLGPAAFEAYMDFCDSLKNGKNNAAIDRVKYACAVCEGYITPAKPLTESQDPESILKSIGSLDKKIFVINKFIDEKGIKPLTKEVIGCFYNRANDAMSEVELFDTLCDCAGKGCPECGDPNGKPTITEMRSYGKTYDPNEFCTGPGCGLSDEEDDQFNGAGFGGEEGMSEELNFDHAGYGDNSFVPEESDSEILNRASRMQKDADLKKFLGRANGPYSMSRQSRNDEAAEAEADRYLADAGFENMTSKNGGVRPVNRKFFGDQFNV